MKTQSQLIAENKKWAEEMLAKVDKKMSAVTLRSRNKLPDGVDKNGVHIDLYETRPNAWVNGFFGGLNAMLYSYTGNGEYLKTLESSEKLLDRAFNKTYDVIHHDVGFMWYLTSGAKFRLTGDEESRKRCFYAAATLMGRFVLGANFIKAWNVDEAYDWSIIDCLMNLPLLYFASREFGDDRYKRVAMAHADCALATHIRPDGSVIHIVEHDRDTGEVRKTYGGQGICDGSSWSRGQAWAVYGFVISYIHTGELRYLDAAKRVANYFIANCCDDWLPRADFRAPCEPVYYDSTAGVCAACGMLELGKLLPENEGGMYTNAAINMLRAITEKFVNFNPETDDMVNFGTVRYPLDPQEVEKYVHISIIYGDFFYTEALLKILGSEFFLW
jgi:unsaturated chondroitin disaccharide hydrolase